MMKNQRKAFTLIEIIIAMALMLVLVLSIFMLNQSANKSSMDAYYEMLAFSLAREPIEIFRGMGYDVVKKIENSHNLSPEPYTIDTAKPIVCDNGQVQYPFEAQHFTRTIELKNCSENYGGKEIHYIKVTVTVEAKGQSKAQSLFTGGKKVVLESNIMELQE